MKALCNDILGSSLTEGPAALLSHERLKDAISLLDGSYTLNYENESNPFVPLKAPWGTGEDIGDIFGSPDEAMAAATVGPPNMTRVKRALDEVGIAFSVAVETQADRDAKRRRLNDLIQGHTIPRPDSYALVLKGR
jgi:hypothetical protein